MIKRKVLFLCPHGAAKSVIAKAFFNQFAQQLELPFSADSAGTEPDETVSPKVVMMLAEAGIDVSHHIPRHVTADDLESAEHVVSMGCMPQELDIDPTQMDLWDDIPMVSLEPKQALNVIRARVEQLINELESSL